VEVQHSPCPQCWTYLPVEDGQGRYEGSKVRPRHKCLFGQRMAWAEVHPVDSADVVEMVFLPWEQDAMVRHEPNGQLSLLDHPLERP